eukprot:1878526-Rhodomonas_salina.5
MERRAKLQEWKFKSRTELVFDCVVVPDKLQNSHPSQEHVDQQLQRGAPPAMYALQLEVSASVWQMTRAFLVSNIGAHAIDKGNVLLPRKSQKIRLSSMPFVRRRMVTDTGAVRQRETGSKRYARARTINATTSATWLCCSWAGPSQHAFAAYHWPACSNDNWVRILGLLLLSPTKSVSLPPSLSTLPPPSHLLLLVSVRSTTATAPGARILRASLLNITVTMCCDDDAG